MASSARWGEIDDEPEPDHPEWMTTDVADGEMVSRRLPQSSGEPARAVSGDADVDTEA